MSNIDIFSKIELPKKEVFKYLSNSNTIFRCVSPFFKIENFRCTNSKLDLDSHYIQKCVFSDLLQLFFKTKEIIPDKKITFQFEGLIKGTQTIQLIDDDETNCLLREKIDFTLWNQFNLPVLDFILSIFFYVDAAIRHLRLKSIIYKDNGEKDFKILSELSTIRSYIVIDSDINIVSSLFYDLNRFALWLSPFVTIKTINHEFKEGTEFLLTFILPLMPPFSCKIIRKENNKIIISFSNPVLAGKNIWSIFQCDNELVIQNSLELDQIKKYLEPIWLIIGNTIVRGELTSWNKRLKEIAEKTNVYKYLEAISSPLGA